MLWVYSSICEQLQRLPLEEDERVSHRWLASNGCLNQIMSWIYLYSLCRYSPYHTKSYHAIPNHIVNEVMSARCCISKYHGCKDATGFGLPLGTALIEYVNSWVIVDSVWKVMQHLVRTPGISVFSHRGKFAETWRFWKLPRHHLVSYGQ